MLLNYIYNKILIYQWKHKYLIYCTGHVSVITFIRYTWPSYTNLPTLTSLHTYLLTYTNLPTLTCLHTNLPTLTRLPTYTNLPTSTWSQLFHWFRQILLNYVNAHSDMYTRTTNLLYTWVVCLIYLYFVCSHVLIDI